MQVTTYFESVKTGGYHRGMTERVDASSPLAQALARVGDRWTLLLVEALLDGPLRFNDLLGQIPGLAPNILSERLKRLERDGLLTTRPRPRGTANAAPRSRSAGTAPPATASSTASPPTPRTRSCTTYR